MIDVIEFINNIMKKEKISRTELCKRINDIEEKANLKRRTTIQNVTNYLNGYHNIRPKWLVKVEIALSLPPNLLVDMVEKPKTRIGREELEKIKEVLRRGADND